MKKIVITAAILAFGVINYAQADTIRATSAFGPKHVMAQAGYPALFKKLKELTDGRWTGYDTPSGLVGPNEMNSALREGITDMGPVMFPYFSADYIESGIVGDLSMLGTDNRAIASAVSEYIATCPECIKEFSKNGQVYLGSDATTAYQLLSTKRIESLSDLKGLRVRTGGATYSYIIEKMGALPVYFPASEIFEALSSGVADATYSSIPDLKNIQLYDAVKYVTLIDKGVFNAAAMTNLSQRVWDKMSLEDRSSMARAAQYAQTIAIYSWRDTAAEAEKIAKEKGIEFIQPDKEFVKRGNDIRDEYMAGVTEALTKKGVTNAAAKVDRYKALLKKWEGLVANVTTSDELAELRYKEIWSKVDMKTYGSH
ncbi:MAG: C4-dicarboxylate TRAP transporter substrate-binding protein [Gammaproteobacteria bacterium]|jgi:TRAP-type transport system periplasmic protein|uniref:C4-dicarboxylate TRAP transporter substrate-binding protein n=1 Tax=Marinomonas polaris TaxID=293552 RepID=UPI001D95CEC0|nr:C4-dicarboxylate TRAP transporter substrate-binding protein [Gammaproteobacteria bacterium]MBU2318795.1 C4-dicarboxylate TRAP transporter substrate-binding protein [Gammaproteobacteria bacterium]